MVFEFETAAFVVYIKLSLDVRHSFLLLFADLVIKKGLATFYARIANKIVNYEQVCLISLVQPDSSPKSL